MVFAVATQATSASLFGREVLEADDLRDISSPRHVFGSGAMTAFTAMPVLESRLEMRGRLKVLVIKLFMAGLAHIGADIFGARFARQGTFFLLTGGYSRLNPERQHDPCYGQNQDLFVSSVTVHDPIPSLGDNLAKPASAGSTSTPTFIPERTLRCHCFWTFEIRSSRPSVFKISGEASSVANG